MNTRKRKSDIEHSILNKSLKLDDNFTLGDLIIDSTYISDEIKTTLAYDFVINSFVVSIRKQKVGENERSISLEESDLYGLNERMKRVKSLIEKYQTVTAPNPIIVKSEVSDLSTNEYGTVMFVKENIYKRGEFFLDIRKCVKKEDHELQYTKSGVYIPGVLVEKVELQKFLHEKKIRNT